MLKSLIYLALLLATDRLICLTVCLLRIEDIWLGLEADKIISAGRAIVKLCGRRYLVLYSVTCVANFVIITSFFGFVAGGKIAVQLACSFPSLWRNLSINWLQPDGRSTCLQQVVAFRFDQAVYWWLSRDFY